MSTRGDEAVDSRLVAAISLPDDARIPGVHDGRATSEEYDRYFRIVRNDPDLPEWTRTCVDTLDAQLADLELASLSGEQKCQILGGILLIFQATLRRWLASGEALGDEVG